MIVLLIFPASDAASRDHEQDQEQENGDSYPISTREAMRSP
jgi:hypothetical protein